MVKRMKWQNEPLRSAKHKTQLPPFFVCLQLTVYHRPPGASSPPFKLQTPSHGRSQESHCDGAGLGRTR